MGGMSSAENKTFSWLMKLIFGRQSTKVIAENDKQSMANDLDICMVDFNR